jgi:hypothetical protein
MKTDCFDLLHSQKRKFAFEDVLKSINPQMIKWYENFQKAKRIKELAYQIAGYSTDQKICDKMDKRVNFAWQKVTEIEPFQTFINGELTDKAAYYLNGIMILKLTKQI